MFKDPKFYIAVFLTSVVAGVVSRKLLSKIPKVGALFA